MILQRQISRKYKGVKYVKWTISIPPSAIRHLGWVQGETLRATVLGGKGGKLIIEAAFFKQPRGHVDVMKT